MMLGMAMLTIVVSSRIMKKPMQRTSKTTQGFVRVCGSGRFIVSPSAARTASHRTAGQSGLHGRLNARQEIVEHLDEALGLLGVGHVRTVLEQNPLGARYAAVHGLRNRWGRLVVAA